MEAVEDVVSRSIITTAANLRPEGWCGDAAVADLKQDGWPDVYFLNMMGANQYFENQRGRTFVEKTQAYFPRTSWGAMGVKFLDDDNDSRLDLFVTDMHSDMSENVGPEQETGNRAKTIASGIGQTRRVPVR